MRRAVAFIAVAAMALAGCGSTKTVTVTTPLPHTTVPTTQTRCLAGLSFMGCSTPTPPPQFRLTALPPPPGPEFPDVSSWQQNVGWDAVAHWQDVHHWPRAAVFKLGEYVSDPYAARNASETARLHFWRAGYWFVRNTGWQHELGQITAAGHAYGLKVIALDEEVGESAGYDVPLTNGLKKAGFIVITYTGNGTWPGGTSAHNPLWDAAYVGDFHAFCNRLWTCDPLAWQFTDGTFRSPVFVPGIGTDDVSVDRHGITKLGAAPVDPLAFLPKTIRHFGKVSASEYYTVKTFDAHNCSKHSNRVAVCASSRAHLKLLSGRVYFVAHNQLVHGHWSALKKARWSAPNKQQPYGSRYHAMTLRLNSH